MIDGSNSLYFTQLGQAWKKKKNSAIILDKKILKKKKNEFYFIIFTKKKEKNYKENRRICLHSHEWNFYVFRVII